jgi:hypothetical protein
MLLSCARLDLRCDTVIKERRHLVPLAVCFNPLYICLCFMRIDAACSITVCFPEQIVVCSVLSADIIGCTLVISCFASLLSSLTLFFYISCFIFFVSTSWILLISFLVVVFCHILLLVLAFYVCSYVSSFLFQFVLTFSSVTNAIKWCHFL